VRVVGADEMHLGLACLEAQMSAWMYSKMWPMWNAPFA
jgi:hypothetical protein